MIVKQKYLSAACKLKSPDPVSLMSERMIVLLQLERESEHRWQKERGITCGWRLRASVLVGSYG